MKYHPYVVKGLERLICTGLKYKMKNFFINCESLCSFFFKACKVVYKINVCIIVV